MVVNKILEPNKINILIVDDEPDILELFSEEMLRNGYNVKTANSGNEAVEYLKSNDEIL